MPNPTPAQVQLGCYWAPVYDAYGVDSGSLGLKATLDGLQMDHFVAPTCRESAVKSKCCFSGSAAQERILQWV